MVTKETKRYDFIKKFNAQWYYIILREDDLVHCMCEGMYELDIIYKYIINIL